MKKLTIAFLLLAAIASATTLTPLADKRGGPVEIVFDSDPGQRFILCVLETVLAGNKDLGMFPPVRGEVDACSGEFAPEIIFKQARGGAGTCEGTGAVGPVVVTITLSASVDRVDFTYTASSTKDLKRVQIHPCFKTTGAPAWIGKRSGKTYLEFGKRIMLAAPGRKALSRFGGNVHQSVCRRGGWKTQWAWWVNSRDTFTAPVMELYRRDGTTTHITFYCEATEWESSNMGDDRCCLHQFLRIGDMKRGQFYRVRGLIRFIKGR